MKPTDRLIKYLKFPLQVLLMMSFCIVAVMCWKFYPVLLDSSPITTIRIYGMYLRNENIQLSDVFLNATTFCSIGPYDSFDDSRFRSYLSPEQIANIRDALGSRNVDSGDNRFLLVGLNGNSVTHVYNSVFFDSVPFSQRLTNLDCTNEKAFLQAMNMDGTVTLKLIEGK